MSYSWSGHLAARQSEDVLMVILSCQSSHRGAAVRMSRPQFITGGLMALIAAVALTVAASREDSRLAAGTTIVVTCVTCLTCKLAADSLASRKAEGRETSRSTQVMIVSVSAAIAVAVLGASDLAFLVVYCGYMVTIRSLADHYWPWEESEHIFIGTVLGGIAALRAVSVTTGLIRTPIARLVTACPSSPEPELPVGIGDTGDAPL